MILANGAPWPVMQVERRKYRFRILNASISRSFNLALSSGEPMTIIGHDGGLAPAPVEVASYRHGMAERYEVVIDFAKYDVGESVVLKNRGLPNTQDFSTTNQVMRFDVVSEATDLSNNEIPSVLNDSTHPYSPMKLQESQSKKTRRFEFGRECVGGIEGPDGACVGGEEMWTISVDGGPGRIWDPNRVDANPGLDDVEIWEFTNKSGGWFHPVHVHLVDFKILDRNGKPPHPWERGPKDVVYIGEGETVRLIMKFGPQKGKYMIHCHNLVHEDHDMMTQFEVGSDGPAWASDPAKPASEAPPLFPTDPDSGSGGGSGTGGGSTTPQPPPVVNAAPVVAALRPRHNSRTRDRTPTIVARVRDSGTDLSKGNMHLYIDNREIKRFAYNRTTDTLSYTSKALRLGRHTAKVIATDAQGRRTTKSWSFSVVR